MDKIELRRDAVIPIGITIYQVVGIFKVIRYPANTNPCQLCGFKNPEEYTYSDLSYKIELVYNCLRKRRLKLSGGRARGAARRFLPTMFQAPACMKCRNYADTWYDWEADVYESA